MVIVDFGYFSELLLRSALFPYTTLFRSPVVPLAVVNGPIRDKLNIPYRHGCLGGAPSTSVAIGRAIRLIVKNIADRKSTRLNSSHVAISYAVFCLKKKNIRLIEQQ